MRWTVVAKDAWRTIPAGMLSRIDLIPHAIYHEAEGIAAIGFVALLRLRRSLGGGRLAIPTERFDRRIPCTSELSGYYQATALAFRGFQELRPDLVGSYMHVLMHARGIDWVVGNRSNPKRSEHVRADVARERQELLEAVEPYGRLFRRPLYDEGWPLPRPLALQRKRMLQFLERRLLAEQLGVKRPPGPGLMVSLDEIGRMLAAVQGAGDPIPPLLPAIVAHLRGKGVRYERIAEALQQDSRVVRNAMARWKVAEGTPPKVKRPTMKRRAPSRDGTIRGLGKVKQLPDGRRYYVSRVYSEE